MNRPILAVDFDGTLVSNDFPRIGHDIGAGFYLSVLQSFGFQLILWTCRTEGYLAEMNEWLAATQYAGVFDSVNAIAPEPAFPDDPRKVYADLYVDDRAIGAPLIQLPAGRRPHFDWRKGGPMLLEAADRILAERLMPTTGMSIFKKDPLA